MSPPSPSSARPPLARHHHRDFGAAHLAAAKERLAVTVSVCIPARDEERTVGDIVEAIRRDLVEQVGLVDEILVIDDHSTDHTVEVALAAGAKVVDAATVLTEYGEGPGKGETLWKSVFCASGDLIVWCDADIRDFGSHIVSGLLGPLLTDPAIGFVKGFYRRPTDAAGRGGGRVTELVARPLLSLLFPELAAVVQPLAGEYAARRTVVERVPFVRGYGVDLALLIDVAAHHGVGAIAQVDLDERVDRNRPLDELSPQAMAILQTALGRAGSPLAPTVAALERPDAEPVVVDVSERPPLIEVPDYRGR